MQNIAYADLKPAFIAFPRTPQGVQRCLQCSARHFVPCVVKNGGHSRSGDSTIDDRGFVINLAKMNRVDVNGDTVVAQAGAKWSDIYNKLDANQLIVGPVCPTVGVSGYTLGGGYSLLARTYGLGSDNVVSMTMAKADGSGLVVVNATTNPDLYWALKGGGGGNFGIVTEFTLRIHPARFSNYIFGKLLFDAAWSCIPTSTGSAVWNTIPSVATGYEHRYQYH